LGCGDQEVTVQIGTRLGPYEIIAALGAGGMGEVYRARDTKLDRDVALKVLPESFIHDPDRLARFQREAKVLAALNHPNIAHIHGLEESDGVRALVMELVEGEDLAQRLTRGAIPIDEALPIAKQIADALEAAHEQGIIHRDLKPANIKVRANGTVKVLDFGLAKAIEPAGSSPELSQSPTITSRAMTHAGMILGTAAYMSPEQARGTPVDRRTDVWAFGCVLYEILCGRPAFAGETISDTIARVLEREPDWHALPGSIPSRIRDLLRRCLQKDRNRRLRDIVDASVEIGEADLDRARLSRRTVSLVFVAGVALAAAVVGGVWYWSLWPKSAPSTGHVPVSVLVADLQNRTSDLIFDRTLEPMLRLGLEGANFITAYDRSAIRGTLGVRPPDRLDEQTAREMAVREGLGVVLSGSVAPQDGGYLISLKAVQSVSGQVIVTVDAPAATKEQVLSVATRLIAGVRRGLGDDASDSAQLFGMVTLSTASLEAVEHFAAALEASTNNRFEEAFENFSKAVQLDPKFGAGYIGMAAMSGNLGKEHDALKYAEEALHHLDGMTERERFNARGMYYLRTGDYHQCEKEYSDLVHRFAGDVYARNRLAICAVSLRDLQTAVEEMHEVVKIVPKRAIFRVNLGLYESYSGDFQAGEQEARIASDLGSPLGLLPLAFAQLGQGQLPQAVETYQALGRAASLGNLGASLSASGLGDLAIYQGRFTDARRYLEDGAAADLKASAPDKAAAKFASLGYAYMSLGQVRPAVDATEMALANSQEAWIRFLSARVLIDANRLSAAEPLIKGLTSEMHVEPQAFAKILRGDALLKSDPHRAIAFFNEANTTLDTWLGHFDLGRAYLEAGLFTQADSEFDRCLSRRGEALALFNDEPSFGYLPPVYYYQGRAREGLKTERFTESYREYIKIRGASHDDPLLQEVKRRAGG
jgi:tetratricopeptide (TPR) repeat protein